MYFGFISFSGGYVRQTCRYRGIDEDTPKYQVAIARGVPVLPKLNRLSFAVQKSPHFLPCRLRFWFDATWRQFFGCGRFGWTISAKIWRKKTGFPPKVGDVLFSNYNLELPPTQDSSDHPNYSIFSRESIPINLHL